MALCARRAEKTNRFPWKEIMFRLHLRRPHKADLSPVCCGSRVEEEQEEEESAHTATLKVNVTRGEDLRRSNITQQLEYSLVRDKTCHCVVVLLPFFDFWPS